MRFGELLRFYRQRSGKYIHHIAQHVGWSQNAAVTDTEAGRRPPPEDIKILTKLMDFLELNEDEQKEFLEVASHDRTNFALKFDSTDLASIDLGKAFARLNTPMSMRKAKKIIEIMEQPD